jgi:hypothetical protein
MKGFLPTYKVYVTHQDTLGPIFQVTISPVINTCLRYVDSYRGISVQLGGEETDLKATMDKQGFSLNTLMERAPGATPFFGINRRL